MKPKVHSWTNPLYTITIILLAWCIWVGVPTAFADPVSKTWTCQSFVKGTWSQRNNRLAEWANQYAPNELQLQAAGTTAGGNFIYACGR